MLGHSPPPYQSIRLCMMNDSSLMGVFPSALPNIEKMTVNMISSFGYDPKGKKVVDSTSLSLREAMYNVVQSFFDDHIDDLHLVASDPYYLPY